MQMKLLRRPAIVGPPRFSPRFVNGAWVVFDRHKWAHCATGFTQDEVQAMARDANQGKITFERN